MFGKKLEKRVNDLSSNFGELKQSVDKRINDLTSRIGAAKAKPAEAPKVDDVLLKRVKSLENYLGLKFVPSDGTHDYEDSEHMVDQDESGWSKMGKLTKMEKEFDELKEKLKKKKK